MPTRTLAPDDASGASDGPASGPTQRVRLGAVPGPDGVRFTVWAPKRRAVHVAFVEGVDVPLERDEHGYFSATVPRARPGDRYWYRLDGEVLRADPASRWQPEGPEGPSEIVDPAAFAWTDGGWAGPPELHRSVLYEMHVGTFTPAGTWEAAGRDLPRLAALGITLIELMPVNEFPGSFGWGYDGVGLFATYREYGRPDDARRFVDAAHGLGLGVILDVVYNHFGPRGCYLRDFSDAYFTTRYENEWGEALNFDGDDAGPVRAFFVENAVALVEEFHLDGLRLDATQAIHDASPRHVVEDICREARAAAPGRRLIVVAENEPQDVAVLRRPDAHREGADAMWNDDYHHAAVVALTGRSDAYYSDYQGSAQEFVSMALHGFLYQGQWYTWQQKGRGTSTRGLPSSTFVTFLENHDQVANSGFGIRLHQRSDPALWRAMTAHLLLGPGLPMLFQGQEFGSSQPFVYFADHDADLAEQVAAGRAEFLAQFPALASEEARARLPKPHDAAAFARSKLSPIERAAGGPVHALHRDLLALRRGDPVISALGTNAVTVHGATLGEQAFVLRYAADTDERLLVLNLGRDLVLQVMNDPLLAPPAAGVWAIAWCSDEIEYGGTGRIEMLQQAPWKLPGHSAYLLRAVPAVADPVARPGPAAA